MKLKDREKFTDCDGNIIEIETRGERNYKLIYFKVKDVSAGFEMPSLQDNLIDKDKGYQENTDYKYFVVQNPPIRGICDIKIDIKNDIKTTFVRINNNNVVIGIIKTTFVRTNPQNLEISTIKKLNGRICVFLIWLF